MTKHSETSGGARGAKSPFVQVGKVAVDSGTIWLGDPCYILHKKTPPEDLGKDWHELARRMIDREQRSRPYGAAQFRRSIRESPDPVWRPLGVTVRTGFGDGIYPVEVRVDRESGRIAEVRVVFIERRAAAPRTPRFARRKRR